MNEDEAVKSLLALTCTDGESWSALGFVKLKEKM